MIYTLKPRYYHYTQKFVSSFEMDIEEILLDSSFPVPGIKFPTQTVTYYDTFDLSYFKSHRSIGSIGYINNIYKFNLNYTYFEINEATTKISGPNRQFTSNCVKYYPHVTKSITYPQHHQIYSRLMEATKMFYFSLIQRQYCISNYIVNLLTYDIHLNECKRLKRLNNNLESLETICYYNLGTEAEDRKSITMLAISDIKNSKFLYEIHPDLLLRIGNIASISGTLRSDNISFIQPQLLI